MNYAYIWGRINMVECIVNRYIDYLEDLEDVEINLEIVRKYIKENIPNILNVKDKNVIAKACVTNDLDFLKKRMILEEIYTSSSLQITLDKVELQQNIIKQSYIDLIFTDGDKKLFKPLNITKQQDEEKGTSLLSRNIVLDKSATYICMHYSIEKQKHLYTTITLNLVICLPNVAGENSFYRQTKIYMK